MSETVFTKVDYDLGSLVKYIGLGEIGLATISLLKRTHRHSAGGRSESF